MKDYMQEKYPELEGKSRIPNKSLRQIVVQAWDSISSEYLLHLIESMPNRCQAVIEAREEQLHTNILLFLQLIVLKKSFSLL